MDLNRAFSPSRVLFIGRRPGLRVGPDVHMQRHQVDAMGTEGSTADQAFGRQGQPGPESVLGERLNGVVRAARVEAARRDPARGRTLVRQDRADRRPRRQVRRCSGVFHDDPRARSGRPQQRFLDERHELRRLTAHGRRLDPEQIGTSGQGAGDTARRLPHAPAQRVTDHSIATVFPNCVSHLGIHTGSTGIRRDEGGAHRPATRPGTGTLQLAECCPGLDSSNRPGGHEQLRR